MNSEGLEWMHDWTAGVRLWLERAGEAILGPGRMELLEAIARCHSISAAAREIGMSYRHAWLLVEGMNKAAGVTLVRRQTGGRGGGGAELTPQGAAAIQVYRQLQGRVQQTAAGPFAAPVLSDPSIIHVAAAASLEDALHVLLADFAAAHPGVTVRTICGASDELADQIVKGVHVDLFLSAADEPLYRLEAANILVPDSRLILSANRLCVIAASSGIADQRGPRALLQKGVRSIALAAPSCPLGQYTRSYLESLGVWESIRPRVLFLDNPRVVLAAVESGQSQVGIVYHSDARGARSSRILFSTPRSQPAIRYSAALTRRGRCSAAACELLAFLLSSHAQRQLRRFGFLKPAGERSRLDE